MLRIARTAALEQIVKTQSLGFAAPLKTTFLNQKPLDQKRHMRRFPARHCIAIKRTLSMYLR